MAFATTKKNLSSSLMSGPNKSSEVATSCSAMVREAATAAHRGAAHRRGPRRCGRRRPVRMSHALAIAADLPYSHPDQGERLMSVCWPGSARLPDDQAYRDLRLVVSRGCPGPRGRCWPVAGAPPRSGARFSYGVLSTIVVRWTPGGRPDLLQQVLQLGRGRDAYLEDVVLVARHAVAGLDRGQVGQPFRGIIRRRRVERLDRDERGQWQPGPGRVDQRGVPLMTPRRSSRRNR